MPSIKKNLLFVICYECVSVDFMTDEQRTQASVCLLPLSPKRRIKSMLFNFLQNYRVSPAVGVVTSDLLWILFTKHAKDSTTSRGRLLLDFSPDLLAYASNRTKQIFNPLLLVQ